MRLKPLRNAARMSIIISPLSFPDPVKEFDIPVFTRGQYGIERIRVVVDPKPIRQ